MTKISPPHPLEKGQSLLKIASSLFGGIVFFGGPKKNGEMVLRNPAVAFVVQSLYAEKVQVQVKS